MARRNTTYSQFSWQFFTLHLMLIAGLTGLFVWIQHTANVTQPLFFAFACYFAYGTFARALILPRHQQGMRLFRRGRYAEAISAFQRSETFLAAHPWIDEFRWIVLLSASGISYREMAMFNIGKAHVMLGRAPQARRAFEHFLALAPRSPLAPYVRAALSTLATGKKKS